MKKIASTVDEAYELSKELKKAMHGESVVNFSFMKMDGTTRDAYGTLNEEALRKNNALPKDAGYDVPDDVVRYYDVDKDGWRSFRIENLISVDFD